MTRTVHTARERMERVVFIAAGIGAIVFTTLLTTGPSGFLEQRDQLEPWFWFATLALSTVLPVSLIGVALWSLPAARRIARVAVAGFLACQLLWLPAMTVPALAHAGDPWLQGINALPSTLAVVAWRGRWSWTVAAAQGPLVTVVQLNASSSTATAAVLDGIGALIFCSVLAAIATAVVRAADAQDEAADRARTQASLEARRRTQEQELGRIDAIVHDDILSVLLTASRADAPATLAAQATQALESVTTITDPERDAPVSYTASEVVALLRATTGDIVSDARLEYELHGSLHVPRGAAAALAEALGEALRNADRHAGSRAHVSIRILVRADAVVVTVIDDGDGFVPGSVAAARLGIRVSIVDRMASVRGGTGAVTSRPGRGTRVTLTWRPT